MKNKLIETYLDWVNNFLTVGAFAEHYGITKTEANFIIKMGKKYHLANISGNKPIK